MPLSIKDSEADRLARAVAEETGETLTQAVITALRERLARVQHQEDEVEALVQEVMELGQHCAALPVLDPRTPDEILGYDGHGLPHGR
jgi:antitoxin VapB